MWAERVDASNLLCRIHPRGGVAAEVLWSESLAYDRYARYYGAEPPFSGRAGLPRLKEGDRAQTLFAAPRFMSFSRRLARRGLPSSPVSMFDPKAKPTASLAALTQFAMNAESEALVFNGMCPGIEQAVQRNASRSTSLVSVTSDKASHSSSDPNPTIRPLTFVSWNIHDGGGSHGRYAGILRWLQDQDADVVGLVEANGWESAMQGGRGRRMGPRSRQGQRQGRQLGEEMDGDDDDDDEGEGEGEGEPPGRTLAEMVVLDDADFADGDDALYASGRRLKDDAIPPRGTPIDTTAHLLQQTAGFRRRAAAAGYTHSHLLALPSGYHLALLSALPMTVVYEDTEHFERGVLVADIGGVRFVLVHLHAQDVSARRVEAQWVARLVRGYTAAGIPAIVFGDFNTLSPHDAQCHAQQDVADRLEDPQVPQYLRGKYMCDATAEGGDPDCVSHQPTVQMNGTVADAKGKLRIDYRPLQEILSATPSSPLMDLTLDARAVAAAAAGVVEDKGVERGGAGGASTSSSRRKGGAAFLSANGTTCLVSYPTAALGQGDDAGNDNGHIPLRIDFALANSAFVSVRPAGHCLVGGVEAGESLDPHLLTLSDHLPLVCRAT
jgi:endonuclease/exonuclease/phosphatase family metal-dependent hydrolase